MNAVPSQFRLEIQYDDRARPIGWALYLTEIINAIAYEARYKFQTSTNGLDPQALAGISIGVQQASQGRLRTQLRHSHVVWALQWLAEDLLSNFPTPYYPCVARILWSNQQIGILYVQKLSTVGASNTAGNATEMILGIATAISSSTEVSALSGLEVLAAYDPDGLSFGPKALFLAVVHCLAVVAEHDYTSRSGNIRFADSAGVQIKILNEPARSNKLEWRFVAWALAGIANFMVDNRKFSGAFARIFWARSNIAGMEVILPIQ